MTVKVKEGASEVIVPDDDDIIQDALPKEDEDVEDKPSPQISKEKEPLSFENEDEKKAWESLSEDDRSLLQSEEAKFVGGKFRVPVERISRVTHQLRDEQKRVQDLQATLETIRYQQVAAAPRGPDKEFTPDEIEEIRIMEPQRAERIVADQIYRYNRQQEMNQANQIQMQQKWQMMCNEGEQRALRAYPELDQKSEKFNQKFAGEVFTEAAQRGYIVPDATGRNWLYLNPAGLYLAAQDIAEKTGLSKTQQDALNEKLRTVRLKSSVGEKKSGSGKTEKSLGLTKEQLTHCKQYGISPELFARFRNKQEVSV